MQIEEAERIDALMDDVRDVKRAYLARYAAQPEATPLADARNDLERRLTRSAYADLPEDLPPEELARAALALWSQHLASRQSPPES